MASAEALLLSPHRESSSDAPAAAAAFPALDNHESPRGTAAPLRLEITSDLAALEGEWRAFEQTADCTVFQSFDWLTAWQRHIGAATGATPIIVSGRRGGDLLFIVPLAVSGGMLRKLTFLGRDVGDYNAPLLAPAFAEMAAGFAALWQRITAELQGDARFRHDVVVLDKMPETVGAQPNPFLQLDPKLHPSGAYISSLSGDWEAYYAAKRSSSTRRRDRSKRKKLSESGELALVTRAPADSLEMLDVLVAQKRKSLARMGAPDMFDRPGFVAFLRDLSGAPAERRLVHLSSLQVGGFDAATNLGLVFRGGYYHVLASYDDGPLSRFGAGAAHLQDLLAYAIGQGCTFFDFTVGDEPYKRDWSDRELKLYDLVQPVSLKGRAAALPIETVRSVKRAIKQSPTLWPLVLRARAALGAVKQRLPGAKSKPAAQPEQDEPA